MFVWANALIEWVYTKANEAALFRLSDYVCLSIHLHWLGMDNMRYSLDERGWSDEVKWLRLNDYVCLGNLSSSIAGCKWYSLEENRWYDEVEWLMLNDYVCLSKPSSSIAGENVVFIKGGTMVRWKLMAQVKRLSVCLNKHLHRFGTWVCDLH